MYHSQTPGEAWEGPEELVEDKDPSRAAVPDGPGVRTDKSVPKIKRLVKKVSLRGSTSPENMSPFPLRTEVPRFQYRTRTDGPLPAWWEARKRRGEEERQKTAENKTTDTKESCRSVIKVISISD